MRIKFLKPCWIECCIGFDRDEEPIFQEEKIEENEEFDVDLLSDSEIETDYSEVQFGNGDVSFINKNLFETLNQNKQIR